MHTVDIGIHIEITSRSKFARFLDIIVKNRTMRSSVLDKAHFRDECAAYAYLESRISHTRRYQRERGRRLLLGFQARHERRLSDWSEKHLHRYFAEFDFRYSNRVQLGVNDTERADRALKGIVGKRLTYS